jgi:hypothetical protein
MAFQPKGTGAIDLAAGSSGVNISNGGTVTAITRTAAGSGYATAPTVAISAPTTAGGVQATATCTVTAGAVNTTFTITNAGSGYIEQPTITFSGGGGSGAAAYAIVGSGTIIRSLANTLDIHTPAGSGFQVNNASGSTLIYSKGVTGYGGFLASSITGNSAFYFGYVNNTEVGRISMTSSNNLSFGTSSAASEQMRVSHTASAVNYVQVTGGATGVTPIISVQGSDTNAILTLRSKGTFAVTMQSSAGANMFEALPTASSVNYLRVTPSIASSAPILSAQGTDTDIDLALTPKGTGLVRFGTYVAGALLATGYINIKAADGTTYKVLVST